MSKDFDKQKLTELYYHNEKEDVDTRADQIFNLLIGKAEGLDRKISQLPQGPLPKNQYTVNFEYIVRASVREKNVKFFIEDGEYRASVNGTVFNFSEILKNMDGRQVIFGKYSSELSDAEIYAISLYTGNWYRLMNGLMRGDLPNDYNLLTLEMIPEVLLEVSLLLSALNKLPDQYIKYTFRTQTDFMDKEIEDSINDPEKVVFMSGFVSSSLYNVRWHGDRVIMFHDVIGKKISQFSAFGNQECEFLMPPMQVKFEAKQEGKDDKGNPVTFYVARPVNTIAGLTNEQMKVGITIDAIQEMIAKIKAMKDAYHEKNLSQKKSFFKDDKAKKLIKKALEIFDDPSIPYEIKGRKILKYLISLENIFEKEKKPILHGYTRADDSQEKIKWLNSHYVDKQLLEKIKNSPYIALEFMMEHSVLKSFIHDYNSATNDEQSSKLIDELRDEFLQLGDQYEVDLSKKEVEKLSTLVVEGIVDPEKFEKEKNLFKNSPS